MSRRPNPAQLDLFDALHAAQAALAPVSLPPKIEEALEAGAALAISISGGKDSQAMLTALTQLHRARGWAGPIFAIHADLGRAEWSETPAQVEKMAAAAGVELVIVRREQGDMVDRIEQRRQQLAGQDRPFWPSAAQRYCTSDLKRNPIDKYLRQFDHVISAEGLRREESPARSKKLPCEIRKSIETRSRHALNWRPILEWTIDDVWAACGSSAAELEQRRRDYRAGRVDEALDGWAAHPAYVYGNERLSCALCVLASRNDLENGARHNPALLAAYVAMEQETGYTFTTKISLTELAASL